ncbi:MAG: OadG family transporter subunit [Clostridia bacterium]|nr:OadG family transporter subunit [Clostridia bacterium]
MNGLLLLGQFTSMDIWVAIAGIAVVFVVLMVLVLYISIQNGILGKAKCDKSKNKAAVETIPAAVTQSETNDGLDDETVAAICAAVSCYLDAEVKKGERTSTGFTVRRITKVNR